MINEFERIKPNKIIYPSKEGNDVPAKHIVWYAIRTFHNQECHLAEFLNSYQFQTFIPMTIGAKTVDGKPKRIMVPIVHNLVFLQKPLSDKDLVSILDLSRIPYMIYKTKDSAHFSEISDREMTEFRTFCDPTFEDTRFVTQEEINAKIGRDIEIIHGPLKGLRGKFVRYGNNYFVVKTLAGICVMVHISRWYCKFIDPQKQ